MRENHTLAVEIGYSLRPIVVKTALQERVRQRMKHIVTEKGVGHAVLAKWIGLSRSAVTRMLNEDGAIMLPHLERFCEFFQMTPSEVVLEPGALVQPLSPLEAAIVDVIRKMDRLRQHSLLDVLEWQRASSIPSKRGRRATTDLSAEDEMILSLYRAMTDSDAQAGIVMQMRGFVRAKHEGDSGPTREGK